MKKIIFALLFLNFQLSFFNLAQAQGRFDAHVFAGLNMSQIDGDRSDGYSHPGLRAGVGTSFCLGEELNSPWRMVVELAFTDKGSSVKNVDQSISLSYVEIPILMSYNTMENRLRIAAGIAPAYCVRIKPLTLSLRYRFTDHLGIEARYQYSALSITKNTGSGTYFLFRTNKGCFNNLVSFALSYTF